MPYTASSQFLFFFFFFFSPKSKNLFSLLASFLQKTIARFAEQKKRNEPWTRADHRLVLSYFLRSLGTRSYFYHSHLYQYMCITGVSVSINSQGADAHKSLLKLRICMEMYRKIDKTVKMHILYKETSLCCFNVSCPKNDILASFDVLSILR